jgi:hypothetical protein
MFILHGQVKKYLLATDVVAPTLLSLGLKQVDDVRGRSLDEQLSRSGFGDCSLR